MTPTSSQPLYYSFTVGWYHWCEMKGEELRHRDGMSKGGHWTPEKRGDLKEMCTPDSGCG